MTMPRTLCPFRLTALAITLVTVGATAMPALAQDGYQLRRGDVLRVEVVEDAGLNRTVLIAPDGRITMPLAGSVQASGRTLEAVQADLVRQLADDFAAPPTVFVSIERLAEVRASSGGGAAAPAAPPTIDIFIMGEAAKPGKIEVAPETTVLQAFAQMGGFSKFAAVKRVQLRRGAEIFLLDYAAIEAGTSQVGSMVLMDGDVIVVPERRLFE
jgi:polysaccharide biosynthesis/export protein